MFFVGLGQNTDHKSDGNSKRNEVFHVRFFHSQNRRLLLLGATAIFNAVALLLVVHRAFLSIFLQFGFSFYSQNEWNGNNAAHL